MNEEKNNNSHQTNQVLLSVLAVAILVVAVVGVSFAFFTYSKQGSTTNTISTGSLVFKYEEEAPGIKLENAIPTTDPSTGVGASENSYFDFSVTSTISGTMTINYEISVKDITVEKSTTDHVEERYHLDPKYVKVALYGGDKEGTYSTVKLAPQWFVKLDNAQENSEAKLLANGQFTGTAEAGTEQIHKYRFLMWFATKYMDNVESGTTKDTMMTPDMCTNTKYMEGEEKIPCDDPIYGQNGTEKATASYNEADKGTNGKTFVVRLDVNAKDAA